MPRAPKKEKTGPKKPLSAYMFFGQSNRQKVVEENPGIGFGEVGKKLGAMWKALSDEEKKPYQKKADEDKKRYEKEKAEGASAAPKKVEAADEEEGGDDDE